MYTVQVTLSILLLFLHPLNILFAFLYCNWQLLLHFLIFFHFLGIPGGEIMVQAGAEVLKVMAAISFGWMDMDMLWICYGYRMDMDSLWIWI